MKPMYRFRRLYLWVLPSILHLTVFAHAAPVCQGRVPQQVLLSRDGRQVFVAIADVECSEVVSLDYRSGRVLWRDAGIRSVSGMALSRDGKRLAVSYSGEGSGQKHPLIVLDAATGKMAATAADDARHGLVLTGKDSSALALLPDGGTLYAIVGLGLVGWNGSTGKPVLSEDDPDGGGRTPTASIDISPDGRWLAGAGKEVAYVVKLPREGAGTAGTVAAISARVRAQDAGQVQFSPDGTQVAIAAGDDTLLWQPGTRRAPVRIPGCGREIAWGANGREFACQTARGVDLLAVDGSGGKMHVVRSRPGLPAPEPMGTVNGILLYSASQPVAGGVEPVLRFAGFDDARPHTIALPARVYPR